MSGVWVGVDLGTQSARALVATGTGRVAGLGVERLASLRDGTRHEQDPDAWWRAVGAACRRALAQADEPREVRGIAVAATSGTVLLTDRRGEPLTPGLMYDDGRAAGLVDRVNEAGARVWEDLGYRRMQPTWALPKVLWLLGEHRRPGARLAHQADFVNRRLTGHEVPADLGGALKTGAHLVDEDWPRDVLDALGVPADLLPRLVRPGALIGTVCADAARHTGLPVGTPVVAGTTDGCAAQIGAGALRPGDWNSVLGTTLVIKGVTREPLRDPLGVVYSHRAPDGGWWPGGASSTGAGVIAREFPGRDPEELISLAETCHPAKPVAYPLVGTGERFPFAAPDAEGFVLGGPPASEGERMAALLAGIGFVERLCFDHFDLLGAPVEGPLTLTGGATRSARWCALRAEILRRPVLLPENSEPALGAAVLAASPGRRLADVAAEMVRIRRTVEPRPGRRFDDAYLRLVGELARRGWLPAELAAHATERTGL
ncbi:FGGY-family carbohydrate kinase [Bailinhaonella thermotolerans]|uniref:FGGY-family carbohydrate kinase n=1 Tax=Bailinhaonella thermotolerans TaxID=1070861 RepID=UPI001F5B5CFF|nr:FGGY family carbohydrate kinase [Bailinhaonella thermotolerans]